MFDISFDTLGHAEINMNRFARDAPPEELRGTLRHRQAMQIKLGGMVVFDIAVPSQLRRLTEADEMLKAIQDAVSQDPEAASRLLHAATTSLLNSQTLALADLELKRRAADMYCQYACPTHLGLHWARS
jgi:hypothetical protein